MLAVRHTGTMTDRIIVADPLLPPTGYISLLLDILFGSFLTSLWSLSNQSLLGSRSRHCYGIKSAGRQTGWSEPLKWHTKMGHSFRERNHSEEKAVLPEISANGCCTHGDL